MFSCPLIPDCGMSSVTPLLPLCPLPGAPAHLSRPARPDLKWFQMWDVCDPRPLRLAPGAQPATPSGLTASPRTASLLAWAHDMHPPRPPSLAAAPHLELITEETVRVRAGRPSACMGAGSGALPLRFLQWSLSRCQCHMIANASLMSGFWSAVKYCAAVNSVWLERATRRMSQDVEFPRKLQLTQRLRCLCD